MKYFLLILFLFSYPFLNTVLGLTQAAQQTLLIPLNKTEILPFSPYQSIHLTNGKLIKVRDYQGKLLATGLKEGETTLTVSKKRFNIFVLEEIKIKAYQELQALTKNMLGLKVSLINNHVYLTGKLLRFSDWQKIIQQTTSLKRPFRLAISASPEILKNIDLHTSNYIQSSELPLTSLSLFPEATIVIPTSLKTHKERYEDLLHPLGFNVLEDKNALSLEPVIDLSVQIVEIKKSSFSKIGIDLPMQYKASVIPDEKLKMSFSSFDVALNALEISGEAKILASPHLSCRSGKEASFLAGGEFPIKILNFHTNDIQWKKHGILLNFKPIADRSGKMSFYLKAEISMLDKAQSVDGVPGILVNRVESHLDLMNSQTIAISGLIKKHSGFGKQGLPVLKDIPVLGLLFSSEDYMEDRTDLVVFVTPKVITEKDYLDKKYLSDKANGDSL